MTATYTKPTRPDVATEPPFDWRPIVWFVAALFALIVFFH